MDVEIHINRIIKSGGNVDDWFSFISDLKRQSADTTLLAQIYRIALSNSKKEPTVGYKKLLVGLANLQSQTSFDLAKDTYLEAKALDLFCAVIVVYYAQFHYVNKLKNEAKQLLASAKQSGCAPKNILRKAYQNWRENKSSLLEGIDDPWDSSLLDRTEDTQTANQTEENQKKEKDAQTNKKTVQFQLDNSTKRGPIRSVNRKVKTNYSAHSNICHTPKATERYSGPKTMPANLFSDHKKDSNNEKSNRRGVGLSPFMTADYSPFIKKDFNYDTGDSGIFTNLFYRKDFVTPIKNLSRSSSDISNHSNEDSTPNKLNPNRKSNPRSSFKKSATSPCLLQYSTHKSPGKNMNKGNNETDADSPVFIAGDSNVMTDLKNRLANVSVNRPDTPLKERHKMNLEPSNSINVKNNSVDSNCKLNNETVKGMNKFLYSDKENIFHNVRKGRLDSTSSNESLIAYTGSENKSSSRSTFNNNFDSYLDLKDGSSQSGEVTTVNSIEPVSCYNSVDTSMKVGEVSSCSDIVSSHTESKYMNQSTNIFNKESSINSIDEQKCNTLTIGESTQVTNELFTTNDDQLLHCSNAESIQPSSESLNTGNDCPDLNTDTKPGSTKDSKQSTSVDILNCNIPEYEKMPSSIESSICQDKTVSGPDGGEEKKKIANQVNDGLAMLERHGFQVSAANNKEAKVYQVKGVCYKEIGVLGKGGSCKVYEVMSQDGLTFALKKVFLDNVDEITLNMYTNEIKWLEKMQGDEHIIRLYDWEIIDDNLLIVLEKGDTDLAHILRAIKTLTMEDMKKYWRQMLTAVNTIHENGIVHADLKPANFLLVGNKLKLIDFGIANGIQDNKTSVTRESKMGTLNYMSPEALSENETNCRISRASDVWSLGCILYSMIYNKTPYSDIKNQYSRIYAILEKKPISYKKITDPLLLNTVQGCLRFNKNERYTIQELLAHPFLSQSNDSSSSVDV